MGLASFKHHDNSRRNAARRQIDAESTLRTSASVPMDAIVSDLSETGFSVAVDARLPIDAPISIGLPGIGRCTAAVVRRSGGSYGCRFDQPIPAHAVMTAFTAQTVVHVGKPVGEGPWEAPVIDEGLTTERWSGRTRLGILAVGSIVPWIVLLAVTQ